LIGFQGAELELGLAVRRALDIDEPGGTIGSPDELVGEEAQQVGEHPEGSGRKSRITWVDNDQSPGKAPPLDRTEFVRGEDYDYQEDALVRTLVSRLYLPFSTYS